MIGQVITNQHSDQSETSIAQYNQDYLIIQDTLTNSALNEIKVK